MYNNQKKIKFFLINKYTNEQKKKEFKINKNKITNLKQIKYNKN